MSTIQPERHWDDVKWLIAEVERYREALEFLAAPRKVNLDRCSIARKALRGENDSK